jgi:hypothetical protein
MPISSNKQFIGTKFSPPNKLKGKICGCLLKTNLASLKYIIS